MSAKKWKLLRTRLGVRLERIEEAASRRRGAVKFKLSTRRAAAERFIADEAEAQRAFAREVAACLTDPHVRRMVQRGLVPD